MCEYHPYLPLKLNLIKGTSNLDQKLKDSVLKFLFVYNVFESEFFKEPKWVDTKEDCKSDYKSVKVRSSEIQRLCDENNYSVSIIEKLHSHFSSVYLEEKTCTERFNSLRKTKYNKNGFKDKEFEHLYDFLIEPISKNRKYAIKNSLLLSYKFRNNLFHGKKDIRGLEEYEDDFEIITDFLISLMKYLDEIGAEDF